MSSIPPFGILNINKSRWVTSRAAVNVVERAVRPLKAGHAGTLDPMATGVLLVCVGRATRVVNRVQGLPKVYRARFRFGCTSDTDDSTGQVQQTGVAPDDDATIRGALSGFVGDLEQVPPAFSAVHVDGKRAYKLARKGEAVTLTAKKVRVDRFELLGRDGDEWEFEIECGSGTYIRSLARDLGEKLGCGGLMSGLERTRIGPFTAESGLEVGGGATPLKKLTAEDVLRHLESPLEALPGLPRCVCDAGQIESMRHGRVVTLNQFTGDGEVAVVSEDGTFVAIGLARSGADGVQLKPRLVFHAIQ